ncbi:MAG: TraB/GumN family protein [Vicinamibacterales bacterium]
MIRRCPRASLVLLAIVLLAVAAHGQTRSFVWAVSAESGPTVYLTGSVHLLSRDYYPLSPSIESAFAASDLLVEELDLAEMLAPDAQLLTLTRGLLPAGQTLEAVVSPPTFDLVSTRVRALGLPLEPLKRFKPWALALTLLAMEWQKAGFEPELGLDRHLYDRARAAGKAVRGLETAAFQVSRFDELTMAEQDRLLAQSLKDVETETAQVSQLADAWKAGDADTIERILLRETQADRRLYERLVVERNQAWLPQIEALFARRTSSMVVVGAAHLVGPDGLLKALASKGYRLQQQ